MFYSYKVMISNCVERLVAGYCRTFGKINSEYAELINRVAQTVMVAIARSDAPYHDLEHTVLVSLVGQEMLRGKHLQEGSVSPSDWLHVIISLICHDIGYIKGACKQDRTLTRHYATGINSEMVSLPQDATDASLTPYHVDRGKQFIAENFANHRQIDIEAIQYNIELTRFPIPNDVEHSETSNYAGLARAADLIGQLGDPCYLQKIPALFREFAETGANQKFGYRHHRDLRASYPNFFRTCVSPYIQDGLHHLEATPEGRQIVANLYANVMEVEQERQLATAA